EEPDDVAGLDLALALADGEHERQVGAREAGGPREGVDARGVAEAEVLLGEAAEPRGALVAGPEADCVLADAGLDEGALGEGLALVGDLEELAAAQGGALEIDDAAPALVPAAAGDAGHHRGVQVAGGHVLAGEHAAILGHGADDDGGGAVAEPG